MRTSGLTVMDVSKRRLLYVYAAVGIECGRYDRVQVRVGACPSIRRPDSSVPGSSRFDRFPSQKAHVHACDDAARNARNASFVPWSATFRPAFRQGEQSLCRCLCACCVILRRGAQLVIAPGAYAATFDIPGVREHAYFLKDGKDARRIRSRIIQCFEQGSQPTLTDAERAALLHFVVVGGGPTGEIEPLPRLGANKARS